MSQFLADFGAILAAAEQDAPPSRSWNELLPRICDEIAQGRDYVAGLWIADDESGLNYTLWHKIRANQAVADKPVCVSVQAAGLSDEDLQRAFEDARSRWGGGNDDWPACHALPLVYEDRKSAATSPKRHLGAISIMLATPVTFSAEIDTALAMAASWLRLNREARVMRALSDLQGERQSVDNTDALANLICQVMAHHANARRMCAVYVPDGNTLVRLGRRPVDADWEEVPIVRHDRASALADFHFGIGPGGTQEAGNNVALLRFDTAGQRLDGLDYLRGASLESLIGIGASDQPLSVLLYRVRDRTVGNHSQPPAVATLVMVCQPLLHPKHESIGGAFTQTHRRTMDHALDYFRNSYALLLQREKMAVIRQTVEQVVLKIPDIMREEVDHEHLVNFVALARDAIPAVVDAFIAERRDGGNGDVHYRYHRANHQIEKPNWFPRELLTKFSHGACLAVADDCNILQYRISTGDAAAPQYRIVLLMRAHKLSMVESHLADQIVAEIRAEIHRHLQRPQWALQLSEVRHNLRSVVTSVLGKSTKIAAFYWPVKRGGKLAEEVKSQLIEQASFHKAVTDLEYAANELLALTENIRTLAGSGTRAPLQLNPINLPKMLHELLGLFKEELSRRHLRYVVDFNNDHRLQSVSADRHWIHILIFNLIENAVKYSRSGQIISLRLWVEGSFWRLEVTNEGKYIPPDKLREIFEPYTRVEAEPGEQGMPGTGLGLASVRAIVDMHQMDSLRPPGGDAITVNSRKDEALSTPSLTHARNIFRISIPLIVRGGE